MRRWVLLPSLVLTLAISAVAQRGALAKPRSLDDLTQEADRIVQVSVLSAKIEPHPHYRNLSTVVVTAAVEDIVKGKAPNQLTYRQFIWDRRDKASLAGYRKGQRLLLFLSKETTEGFTGTAGLNQGRMAIHSDSDGKPVVQAATPNRELLSGMESKLATRNRTLGQGLRAAAKSPDAQLPLNELKQAIRDLESTRRTK